MTEKSYKCPYKNCDNLGLAVNPIKYKNRYYCEKCLDKLMNDLKQKEEENKLKRRKTELRKKIMDTTLEILPKEIPSLINKVITQWVNLGYSMEYILYTVEYIRLNKCVLNHFHGVRYYMNDDEIKKTYTNLKTKHKLKQMENQEFEISDEVVEFKPVQQNSNWSDLI